MSEITLEGHELRNIEQLCRFIIGTYSADDAKRTSKTFYTQAIVTIGPVEALIASKAIHYFRKKIGPSYGLTLLAVVLMNKISEQDWGKKFYYSFVKTPGDVLEFFEILQDKDLKPTKAVKNGFARAFEKRFTERDLGAYQQWDGPVRLADVVRQVHPKHSLPIRKLLGRKLDTASRKKIELDLDKLDAIKKAINTDFFEFHKTINAIVF